MVWRLSSWILSAVIDGESDATLTGIHLSRLKHIGNKGFHNSSCFVSNSTSSSALVDPEPSLTPANLAEPWRVGVKSPALDSCGLVGGLVEMWSLQSEATEWHEGERGGHAVSAIFYSSKLQATGQGGRGQKERLENGFDFHLFLYCINLERKFREAT